MMPTYARALPLCFLLLLAALVAAPAAQAQSWMQSDPAPRPVPYPVLEEPGFEAAVLTGTRTRTGHPGPDYWMNDVSYVIDATLSPASRMLRGRATITYANNSPDTLFVLPIHLRQNLNSEGVVRNRPQKISGGVRVTDVMWNGAPLVERTSLRQVGYVTDGTIMTLRGTDPVAPGGQAQVALSWTFQIPEVGAPRMGTDGEVFYLGYWYPQVAVYDDVNGWTADPYMGNGEFYMDFADYDVRVTVPDNMVVGATGELMNRPDVLSEQTISRLRQAADGDDVVHVVTAADLEAGDALVDSPSDMLTWYYRADQVRDFAFAASTRYVWDATRAVVDAAGNRAMIHALYRDGTPAWDRSAEFARYSIEFLSDQIDMPYPWPHMTTVEGIIGGGMEYPMMTLIGGTRNDRRLFGTTFHEIGHMWFPMIVGQNEKQYTWMDEGLTSFNTAEASADFWDEDSWDPARQSYYFIAGTGMEVEPMRHGDRYPVGTPARGIASYNKPAVALNALRGMLGQERFYEAYTEYARRWAFKHPQPHDLFNTFEDVLGQDLDWFWTTMLFETWTLDQGIASVVSLDSGVEVTVEDFGLSPFPTPVRVTYRDGTTANEWIPVSTWLGGARGATVTFPPGDIERAEIDPDRFLPDVDRSNNVLVRD